MQRYRSLLIGAAIAPVFAFVPLLRYVHWFLGALTHETGHCVAAWAAGCPSFPAISLAGHAAAFHRDQQMAIAILVWAGAGWVAWRWRGIFWALPVLYPLFAFTGVREIVFLFAGLLGELTFASIFFWRALRGNQERIAAGMVATLLFSRNIVLSGGLLFSDQARAEYTGNGSFGLQNDYLRLAGPESLGAIAFFTLLLTLACPVVLCLVERAGSKRRQPIGLAGSPAQEEQEHWHHHRDRAARR